MPLTPPPSKQRIAFASSTEKGPFGDGAYGGSRGTANEAKEDPYDESEVALDGCPRKKNDDVDADEMAEDAAEEWV